MSKVFSIAQDFLDNGGTQLGYSEYDMPNLADMSAILENSIKVWEYHGMTEREYYSGE